MKNWYKKATKFETGKWITLDRDAPVALITHTYNSIITRYNGETTISRWHHGGTWSRFNQVAETSLPTTCQYCVGESTPTTIIDLVTLISTAKESSHSLFVHNLAGSSSRDATIKFQYLRNRKYTIDIKFYDKFESRLFRTEKKRKKNGRENFSKFAKLEDETKFLRSSKSNLGHLRRGRRIQRRGWEKRCAPR